MKPTPGFKKKKEPALKRKKKKKTIRSMLRATKKTIPLPPTQPPAAGWSWRRRAPRVSLRIL
jgi:hypothetical protein